MKKFTIKPGMKFVASDKQIQEMSYFKDYSYTVVKKCGSRFPVRFFNGIGCGEDLFYKYELENMKLIN